MANASIVTRLLVVLVAALCVESAMACPDSSRDVVERAIGGDPLDPNCLRTWSFDQLAEDGTQNIAWALGEHLGIAIESALRDVADAEVAAAVYPLLLHQVRYEPSIQEVDDFRSILNARNVSDKAKAAIMGSLAGLSGSPAETVRADDELIWAFLWVDQSRAAANFKISTNEVCLGDDRCASLPVASCPPWPSEYAAAAFKAAVLRGISEPTCAIELPEKIHFYYYYVYTKRDCTFATSGNLAMRWTTLEAGIRNCDAVLRKNAKDLEFADLDVARVAAALVRSGQLTAVPSVVRSFLDSNGYFDLLRDLCGVAECED